MKYLRIDLDLMTNKIKTKRMKKLESFRILVLLKENNINAIVIKFRNIACCLYKEKPRKALKII